MLRATSLACPALPELASTTGQLINRTTSIITFTQKLPIQTIFALRLSLLRLHHARFPSRPNALPSAKTLFLLAKLPSTANPRELPLPSPACHLTRLQDTRVSCLPKSGSGCQHVRKLPLIIRAICLYYCPPSLAMKRFCQCQKCSYEVDGISPFSLGGS